MKFSLPAFALQRPIMISMLSISMLLLGAIAWQRMPQEFLPDIQAPFVGVSLPYPGATPEEVERQVAIPAEGEFRTIPGLDRIRTISNSNGCFVSLSFTMDTKLSHAVAELRDRLERLRLDLPPEVRPIRIQRFSTQSLPIMALGVFREAEQEEFAHLVRTTLIPRLQRLEGVADVEIHTAVPNRDVLIELDQGLLESLNIGIAPLVATLRGSSLNASVGELKEADKSYFVRIAGEYRGLDDIKNLVISGDGLRLKDVATVRYSSRDEPMFVALDGKSGAFLMIKKESEANAVTTCTLIRNEFTRVLESPAFDNVEQKVFFDQSALISSLLRKLLYAGLYGGAMALIVLFLFLHRFRPTVIVALAIPTSLVVAIVFMFFADMTLNAITMVSMIIAIGMLVDNAIVVVENIIRYRHLGYDPNESARLGASEVGLAILASTATTWVVFIPIVYMDAGQMSILMGQLGLPLIVSLAGSLLIALTLVPLAMSRMSDSTFEGLGAGLHHSANDATQNTQTEPIAQNTPKQPYIARMLDFVIRRYGQCLALSLRWRLASMVLLAAFVLLTIKVPMKKVGMADLDSLDTREVAISVSMDQNFDIEQAQALFKLLETKLDDQREELGIKNVMQIYGQGNANIRAYLYTEDDGPRGENPPFTTQEVADILATRLPERIPGARIRVRSSKSNPSGTSGDLSIRMRGDDTQLLEEYAKRFTVVMENIENISKVDTDTELSRQEMQIKVNESHADNMGVSATTIAQTVYMALAGIRLPYLKQGNREIPVWLQLREEDRRSRETLDNVTVTNALGNQIPISQLVNYTRETSARSIHRVNGKNVVTLFAKAGTENLSQIRKDLSAAASAFDLPVGYSFELGDELKNVDDDLMSFISTLLMAIMLIYLVMSALFESYLFPFSILTSVPMALGGAMWMLFFTGNQLDTITFIGCVLMSGLIVNNGIVIVDHINSLRKITPRLEDAIVQAGKDRFRPVCMTAITTILGLLPLAAATSGSAVTFAGLGRALVGGLSAGTLMTLFIVPIFYSLLEDFQRWSVNILGNLSDLRSPRTSLHKPRETSN